MVQEQVMVFNIGYSFYIQTVRNTTFKHWYFAILKHFYIFNFETKHNETYLIWKLYLKLMQNSDVKCFPKGFIFWTHIKLALLLLRSWYCNSIENIISYFPPCCQVDFIMLIKSLTSQMIVLKILEFQFK